MFYGVKRSESCRYLIPADGVDEGEDLLMLVMPVMLNH